MTISNPGNPEFRQSDSIDEVAVILGNADDVCASIFVEGDTTSAIVWNLSGQTIILQDFPDEEAILEWLAPVDTTVNIVNRNI